MRSLFCLEENNNNDNDDNDNKASNATSVVVVLYSCIVLFFPFLSVRRDTFQSLPGCIHPIDTIGAQAGIAFARGRRVFLSFP